ncbi:MAG: hypothetical protein A2133_03090 [Actinobacteria bacterium RBG_16_64_13]|nr:MAG: hypothetical protein A2133_03090 [Actinobacteria bacterium RBG_16_64_13]
MQPEMDPDPLAMERARRRQQRAERVQRRRLALGVIVLGLIVLIVALAIGLSGGDETATTTTSSTGVSNDDLVSATYSATLVGADAVPQVNTVAAADFILTYDADTKELSFVLEITKGLTSPTAASVYEGTPGTSGAAVYTLFVAEAGSEGTKTGILAQDIIDEAKLIGPLAGGTIAELVQLIKDGNAYVSISNKTHLDAIRGPIN